MKLNTDGASNVISGAGVVVLFIIIKGSGKMGFSLPMILVNNR